MYFSEVQRFRDYPWIWILLIVVSASALIPIGMGLHAQLVLGQPWGAESLSDDAVVALFLAVFLTITGVTFLVLSVRYEVRVDASGIEWRFVPNKIHWQRIERDAIAHLEVKANGFFRPRQYGYHHSILKRRWSMVIGGKSILEVKLQNGETYWFGTTSPGTLELAVKKMMEHTQLS